MKNLKKRKKIVPFDIANTMIMIIMILIFLIPFWIIIATSLNVKSYATIFYIKDITFDAYTYLFMKAKTTISFVRALLNSLLVSVATTALSVAICTMAAFALSRKYFVGRKGLNVFFLITMLFSGGTIPLYLIIISLHINNTIWALIIPSVANTYNILLIRSYFYSIPQSLDEAARLDGASDISLLLNVFIPLGYPIMFMVGLTTFVGKWNSWADAFFYLNSNSEWTTIQLYLKNMISSATTSFGDLTKTKITEIMIQNAAIVMVVIPVVLLATTLHKYLVSGITAGAIKE